MHCEQRGGMLYAELQCLCLEDEERFQKDNWCLFTILVLLWGRKTESTKIWKEDTGKGTHGL